MSYSIDLRKRVVDYVENRGRVAQAAGLFQVGRATGVAELRYDNCGQGMFWLPDFPRLSAIEMIRWIGNRNIPKLKIMNY